MLTNQESGYLACIITEYKASHGYEDSHDEGMGCYARHRGIDIGAGMVGLGDGLGRGRQSQEIQISTHCESCDKDGLQLRQNEYGSDKVVGIPTFIVRLIVL